MIVPVEKQFNALEAQRKQLLEAVSQLSHEQQNFKPSPEAWSVLQVLNHLIYAETNSVKYLQKKVQGIANIPKSGIQAMFRLFVLNTSLRSPLKFRAPKAALPPQEDVFIFDNLKDKWDANREEMRKILDGLDPSGANKLIFKHPVAGRFNIYQTMSFITEHIEHHKKQIERIKAAAGFP